MIKRILSNLKGDRAIWVVIFLLSLFSILAVYSSTGTLAYKMKGGNTEFYLLKQLVLIGGGLFVVYLGHLVDHRYFSRIAQVLLIIAIPLLAYTLFFGTDINDAKRWITLPGLNITFQTSDLAKLALIMYTARILSKKQNEIKSFKEAFLPVLLPVIVVCLLIAPEDLSTAAVLFCTCLLIMFIGRVAFRHIAALVGISALSLGFLIMILFTFPEETLPGRMATWKNRIVNYTSDDVEESYQVQQANIAVASGLVFGKGPGNSSQRNFLPHPYSDFIYAIIIEEYGLLGGTIVLILYLIFLFRCMTIVRGSPNSFGALLAFGLGLSLTIQALINMGVAVNLLPVTGMTLPLVSMGGSSVVFTSTAIGIIISVSRAALKEEKLQSDSTNDLEYA